MFKYFLFLGCLLFALCDAMMLASGGRSVIVDTWQGVIDWANSITVIVL